MNILNSIYQGKESEVVDYYSRSNATQMEFLLAFSLYQTSKDASSLNCLKNVSHSYKNNIADDEFKQRFAQLMRDKIGLDPVFFKGMKDTTILKNFLSEVVPLQNQKVMPEPSVSTSYSSDLRIVDLKKINNKVEQSTLEEELFITVYTEFKRKNMPINDVNNFIDQTRKIRNDFIENSSTNKNLISPLFACLHKDIISAIINEPNKMLNDFNYENLWENISQYNVSNVFNADFETIDLPPELNSLFNESKVKQAIWVLKENGEAAFGGRTTLDFTGKHEVHHTDLANGKSVLSAGTILFSEDMTKIIAINPCSGHYLPTVESCLHMKIAMDKTDFDTRNVVICDLDWKPKIIDVTETFTPPTLNKSIESISSLREKFLNSNKSIKIGFDR